MKKHCNFVPIVSIPIQGFFQIFSLKALVEGLKALMKLGRDRW